VVGSCWSNGPDGALASAARAAGSKAVAAASKGRTVERLTSAAKNLSQEQAVRLLQVRLGRARPGPCPARTRGCLGNPNNWF